MRNLYLSGAILWTVIVILCCLVSMNNFQSIPLEGGYTDKYAHFSFYFIFTVLWFLYLKSIAKPGKQTKSIRILVFIAAVILGIVIEICQGVFTKDRSADVTDALANTTGSAIAILILWLLGRRTK